LGLPNKKTEGDNEIEERQEKRTPGHCSGVDYFLAQKSEVRIAFKTYYILVFCEKSRRISGRVRYHTK
jgi:hypothetical protein